LTFRWGCAVEAAQVVFYDVVSKDYVLKYFIVGSKSHYPLNQIAPPHIAPQKNSRPYHLDMAW
jgi:hypothetical protein